MDENALQIVDIEALRTFLSQLKSYIKINNKTLESAGSSGFTIEDLETLAIDGSSKINALGSVDNFYSGICIMGTSLVIAGGTSSQIIQIKIDSTGKIEMRNKTGSAAWTAWKAASASSKTATITIPGSGWTYDSSTGSYYIQLTISGITDKSKIDLQPSYATISDWTSIGIKMMYIENVNGVIYARCFGHAPTTTRGVQCEITEIQ